MKHFLCFVILVQHFSISLVNFAMRVRVNEFINLLQYLYNQERKAAHLWSV